MAENVADQDAFPMWRFPGLQRPRRLRPLTSAALIAAMLGAASAGAIDLPAPPDAGAVTARDFEALAAGAAAPRLDLPALPEAIATFEAPAEKPVTLAAPDLPQPDVSADIAAALKAEATTGSIATAPKLDLPPVPEVRLSLAPLRLDLTEEKLRAFLEPARQKYRLKPAEIESFAAGYAARDFNAIWLKGEEADLVVSPKAAALREALVRAEASGLDANRLLAVLPAVRSGKVSREKHIETDIGFSLAAFLYARDLRGGRLEPSRVSALMTPTLQLPEARAVLLDLASAEASAVERRLLAFEPRHAGYQNLKKALARLRAELAAPVLTGAVAGIAGAPQPGEALRGKALPQNWLDGPPLAFNKADARVALLRQRLGQSPAGSEIYDADLREAVKTFQRANALRPNGIITPKTRAALENPSAPLTPAERKPDNNATLAAVLANMERWRWLPADLGKVHIFVNVAEFDLKLFENGKIVHETRVIVGRPQTQTPIFSDEMEHVIVNPSWGVPPSIIKKEFLPKMAADPDYAARRGYSVVRRGNQISIRQPPGARNALGYIKFIFPNQHSVYMHDTPNRTLFQNDMRAFSHGCVRVHQPFALAEKLMSTSLGYSEAQLRGMIGHGERMIKLKEHVPVHLTYFTVAADETGEIRQRADLYGHDARIHNALRL